MSGYIFRATLQQRFYDLLKFSNLQKQNRRAHELKLSRNESSGERCLNAIIQRHFSIWKHYSHASIISKRSTEGFQQELRYTAEQEIIGRLHIEAMFQAVTTQEHNFIKQCQLDFNALTSSVADVNRKHGRNYETIVRWLEPQLDYRDPAATTNYETVALKLAAIAVTDLTKLRKLVQRNQTENRGKYIALANLQSAISEQAS